MPSDLRGSLASMVRVFKRFVFVERQEMGRQRVPTFRVDPCKSAEETERLRGPKRARPACVYPIEIHIRPGRYCTLIVRHIAICKARATGLPNEVRKPTIASLPGFTAPVRASAWLAQRNST